MSKLTISEDFDTAATPFPVTAATYGTEMSNAIQATMYASRAWRNRLSIITEEAQKRPATINIDGPAPLTHQLDVDTGRPRTRTMLCGKKVPIIMRHTKNPAAISHFNMVGIAIKFFHKMDTLFATNHFYAKRTAEIYTSTTGTAACSTEQTRSFAVTLSSLKIDTSTKLLDG